VAVTFSTTEPTPVGGTPSRPVTFRLIVEPGANGPPPIPIPSNVGSPSRVSSTRDGFSAL
jgi:hypothetical protein